MEKQKKVQSQKNALPKVKRGHYLVWYNFETLMECLGSYCGSEEIASGEERTTGHSSVKEAIKAAFDNYSDDPSGPGDFKVINSKLEVVYDAAKKI